MVESTCHHDLAPDTQGQWGSETSSRTRPLHHSTASQLSHVAHLRVQSEKCCTDSKRDGAM